jgi:hypothetical protein
MTMETANLFDSKQPVIDRSLIAYAFLAQTNPGNGDLLYGLAPIFKPLAKMWAGQSFDPKEFSRQVEELYQIRIHPWAADDLAPRLATAGLLVKIPETRQAFSYVYADISGEFDEVKEADIRLVVKRFIEYARPLCSQHKVVLDDQRLEDAFFEQLISMDFHAALLKPQRVPDTTLRLPIKGSSTENGATEENDSQKSSISILCPGFIMSMYQTDPATYDLMLRIATGAMVAEAVLNIQSPGSKVNFNQLKIVLDAPFVMALLDLDEVTNRNYAKTLCDQLTSHGATLQVFMHSIEEIREAVNATLEAVDHGHGKGSLARRVGMRTHRQYVLSVLANLQGELRRQGIAIVNVPSSNDSFT